MATTFKWEAFRESLPGAGDTGTFDVADSNAVIDFVFRISGIWIVIYHVTS